MGCGGKKIPNRFYFLNRVKLSSKSGPSISIPYSQVTIIFVIFSFYKICNYSITVIPLFYFKNNTKIVKLFCTNSIDIALLITGNLI